MLYMQDNIYTHRYAKKENETNLNSGSRSCKHNVLSYLFHLKPRKISQINMQNDFFYAQLLVLMF